MNLRREVSAVLVQRGFARNGRMHVLRLDEDFSFWVDTGPIGKRADIAPFVGIRHDLTERIRSDLMGQDPDKWVGTVGANVGYVLGGEYRSWEPPNEAAEVVAVIEEALESLRPLADLRFLHNAWEIQGAKAPGWHYKMIIVLVLGTNSNAAWEVLESARAVYCKHDDTMCQQFLAFESAFQERYG